MTSNINSEFEVVLFSAVKALLSTLPASEVTLATDEFNKSVKEYQLKSGMIIEYFSVDNEAVQKTLNDILTRSMEVFKTYIQDKDRPAGVSAIGWVICRDYKLLTNEYTDPILITTILNNVHHTYTKYTVIIINDLLKYILSGKIQDL